MYYYMELKCDDCGKSDVRMNTLGPRHNMTNYIITLSNYTSQKAPKLGDVPHVAFETGKMRATTRNPWYHDCIIRTLLANYIFRVSKLEEHIKYLCLHFTEYY